MHAFRDYIQTQMDARGWTRTDLKNRSGLSRQQLGRLLTDDRDRLPERPEADTVAALANAFTVSIDVLWLKVAEAMGLPTHEVRIADVELVPDEALIAEIRSRLRSRRIAGAAAAGTGESVTIKPKSYFECRTIGEHYRKGADIVLDLRDCDDADAKRIIDFVAGLSFYAHGSIDRVQSKVFVLRHYTGAVRAEEDIVIAAFEPPEAPGPREEL